MSEGTPKIRIRGLNKSFGPKRVLRELDLDVPVGSSVVVIGGSGTGKSVLAINLLAALLAGKVDVQGKTVIATLSGGNIDAEVLVSCLQEAAAL
jgi:ABC-type transporter Mla maintaining outer membrane lipid asymmetry ATPase subunit MlaF